MRVIAIFALFTCASFAMCMNIADGFEAVKKQEQVVALLLSEVKSLPQDQLVTVDTSSIITKYEDALQKTQEMISKTNELTEQASSGGGEIGDDSDDTEMLYCSTVNSLRKMIEVNETLQRHADATVKTILEEQLKGLRESLK